MRFGKFSGSVARASAVIAVVAALGGCSSISNMFGNGSDSEPSTVADDSAPDSPDASVPQPPDQSAAPQTTASAPSGTPQTATAAPYPDLADTPDRPAAPSTADDQKQVSDSLGADRNRQNYSADQLRAGAESAAAPPPAEAPRDDVAEVDPSAKAGTPPATSAAPAPPSTDSSADAATPPDIAPAAPSTDSSSSSSPDTVTAPATSSAPAVAPVTAYTSSPTVNGPTSGPPAVPAIPAVGSSVPGAQAMQQPNDNQLGFQPSKAPPLDASVAQFVSQPVMARYRQTASVGGVNGTGTGPAVPALPPSSYSAEQAMGGSAMASAGAPAAAPMSSVVFPNDTTILSAAAKEQIRSAAQSFTAQGGVGYIRVVGHASSRSANMSVSRHLQWDFEHSQARANSVARALIADGVPASKVLVNAVGDDNQSDAVSAHRADIFIQS